MRRKDRQISEIEAKRILEESRVGRIGVSTGDGVYIVPVLYLYSPEDNSIYIHSSTEGQKMEALNRNPRVCFEVDELKRVVSEKEVCRCTAEYESVIIFGKASIIEGKRKSEILHRLSWKYGAETQPISPIDRNRLERTAVIRIIIDQITGKANLPTSRTSKRQE